MALEGKIVLEDIQVEWVVTYRDDVQGVVPGGVAAVTVTDLPTGQSESFECAAPEFGMALAIAISHEGDVPNNGVAHAAWWKCAERVQPRSSLLRFIP